MHRSGCHNGETSTRIGDALERWNGTHRPRSDWPTLRALDDVGARAGSEGDSTDVAGPVRLRITSPRSCRCERDERQESIVRVFAPYPDRRAIHRPHAVGADPAHFRPGCCEGSLATRAATCDAKTAQRRQPIEACRVQSSSVASGSLRPHARCLRRDGLEASRRVRDLPKVSSDWQAIRCGSLSPHGPDSRPPLHAVQYSAREVRRRCQSPRARYRLPSIARR